MDSEGNLTDQERLDLVKEVEAEIAHEELQKQPPSVRRDMAGEDAQYYELGNGSGGGQGSVQDAESPGEIGMVARKTAIGLRAMAMEGADPMTDPRVDMGMSEVFHEVADLAEMESPSLGMAGEMATAWVAENPEKAVAAERTGGELLSGNMDEGTGGNDMMNRSDMAVPGYGALSGMFGRARDMAGQGAGAVQGAAQGAMGHVRSHPLAYGAGAAGVGGAGLGYGAGQFMDGRTDMMPMGRSDMGPMDFARGMYGRGMDFAQGVPGMVGGSPVRLGAISALTP